MLRQRKGVSSCLNYNTMQFIEFGAGGEYTYDKTEPRDYLLNEPNESANTWSFEMFHFKM